MAWRSSKVRPGASNHDLAIRPLDLGEIVDRAVALTRRHFRRLFLWMLLVQAPVIAASRIQMAGLGELLGLLGDPEAAAAALRSFARTSLWILAALVVLQAIATAICAAVVAPSLAAGSEGPTPGRRAAAVGTAALANLALLAAAPAVAAVPGLLLLLRAETPVTWGAGLALVLLAPLAALLVAVLRTLLVPVVAAIEGRPHLAAVARSFSLMRAPRGLPMAERPAVRASLVLLATFALALAVNAVVGIPRGIAGRLVGGSALLPATLPAWGEIPLLLFETAASAALQPFSLVAVVVLYFDRRARREGLDLERFAGEVEAGAPP